MQTLQTSCTTERDFGHRLIYPIANVALENLALENLEVVIKGRGLRTL